VAISIVDLRNALVMEHLSLVPPIARRLARILPRSFEIDDLIATGNLGLIQAAARYRPREHACAPFSAYARPVIRGFILSSVRRGAFLEATRPGLVDVPEPASAPDNVEAIDAYRRAWRLGAAVTALPERERNVIDGHYREGMLLRTVGAKVGVGKCCVSRIHRHALDALRARLAV
jgi:RNA polymerase sigma factor (sigma-70 family)